MLFRSETDAARASTELERARARTLLYGSTDSVNQRLALTSGITGVVVERNLNPGQELRPDQFGPGGAALFVVTDPTHLWLQIDVREGDVALVERGKRIEFSAYAHPDRWFPAEIMAVSEAINPQTRTLKVRARIENISNMLKVEMLGKIRGQLASGDGGVLPATAVFSQDGAHWVFTSARAGEFQIGRAHV